MATSEAPNKDFAEIVSQYPADSTPELVVTFSPEATIPEMFDLEVGDYFINDKSYEVQVRLNPDRTSMVCYFNREAFRQNDKSGAVEFLQAAWNNPHVLKVADDGVGDDLLERDVVFFDRNAEAAPDMTRSPV